MPGRRRMHHAGHTAVPVPHFLAERPPVAAPGAHAWLTHCVDGGITAAIFLVPFLMGGRHPLGQLALVAISLVTAALWCLRQWVAADGRWVTSSVLLLWLGGVALACLQIIRLPWSVVATLSPRMAATVPWLETDPQSGATTWRTLSYCPETTATNVSLLIALGLLAIVVLQRVRRQADVEGLLRRVACVTVAMATFGIVQSVAGNGKFFWFYDHPHDEVGLRVGGAFTNENHFAHFVVLGMGAVLWCMLHNMAETPNLAPKSRSRGSLDSRRRRVDGQASRRARSSATVGHSSYWQAGLWAIGLAICYFAVLMSLSRGGIISMAAAILVAIVLLARGRLLPPRVLATGGVSLLLVSLAVGTYGYDYITARLGTLTDLDTASMGRRQLWAAGLQAAADYTLIGSGLGSHPAVYPLYYNGNESGIEFTHAESSPIQLLMESGLIGLALAVMALVACGYWCWTTLRLDRTAGTRLCVAAFAPAFMATTIHATTDFIWYVPGCMVLLVVLGAAACRLQHIACERAWQGSHRDLDEAKEIVEPPWSICLSWPRAVAASACVGLVALAVMLLPRLHAVAQSEAAWERSIHLQKEYLAEKAPDRRRLLLRWMIEDLHAVEAWRPQRERLHTRLAACYQDLFVEEQAAGDNPFTIRDIQETVYAGGYTSRHEMDAWLERALGDNLRLLRAAHAHARLAIVACPLEGENYVCLADTCFLDEPQTPDDRRVYLERAFRVRPHAPAILFLVGKERALRGDIDGAMQCWRPAFAKDSHSAQRVLALVAPSFPVETLIEKLEPDVERLRQMVSFYRTHRETLAWARSAQTGDDTFDDEWRRLLGAYADASVAAAEQAPPGKKVGHYLQAADAYRQRGELRRQWETLTIAVAADATHFQARYALGKCAFDLQRYNEAEDHLRWCLQQKPRDANVQSLHAKAYDKSVVAVGADPIPPMDDARPATSAANRWPDRGPTH